MRHRFFAALLVAGSALAAAQTPTRPPTFDPGDTEGLVVSPNPRIRHAWKRRVFWKAESQPARGARTSIPPHTAAERAQMTAALDALSAVLKATPTGTTGEGFWVNESRTLDYVDPFPLPEKMSLGRFPLVFDVGFYPFYHEDVQTDGKWRLSVRGETESAYFYFNRLPASLDAPPILTEPRPADRPPEPFYLRPRVTATWAGLPVYEGKALVVSRPGRDPWAVVPVARALRAATAALEKDRKTAEARLEGYKKKLDEVMAPEWERQKRDAFDKANEELRTSRPANYAARLRSLENEITVLRQQAQADATPKKDPKGAWYWNPVDAHEEALRRLAALPADEAEAPACFVELTAAQKDGRYSIGGSVVPASSAPGCREIVRTNWDYFDQSLPRSAPQILLLRDFGRCVKVDGDRLVSAPITRWNAPPQGCVQHAQMWREADWTKIASLVGR
jgi:hypothetical protein